MIGRHTVFSDKRTKGLRPTAVGLRTIGRWAGTVLVFAAFSLLLAGLIWNFSTQRYLKGFADAIVPLDGSPQEKSEALLAWFRHEPERRSTKDGDGVGRDPVWILQSGNLLKVCGSASNAFVNLAEFAGLDARRLLLLGGPAGAKHVVAEIKWEKRWVVVDPSRGMVFRDAFGRALTNEELHDPEIYRDAISRMPGYPADYSFEHTTHVRLERLPVIGMALRRFLDHRLPSWENAFHWTFILESPPTWPMLASIPVFMVGVFLRWISPEKTKRMRSENSFGLRKRLINTGRELFYKSA